MAETTGISWTDHTWNPWRGCVKISPGCDNCYAEHGSHRNPKVLGEWGKNSRRAIGVPNYWKDPYRWNKKADDDRVRRRVFTLSLGDFWERRPDLIEPRARALEIINDCQHLDWLILSKRPEHILDCLKEIGHQPNLFETFPFRHVLLGVTVERMDYLWRADVLHSIPCHRRFLSVEPMLGPIELGTVRPNWVIVGGESDQEFPERTRIFRLEWARLLLDECRRADIPYFFKQTGDLVGSSHPDDTPYLLNITMAGKDPEKWPPDLCVQEFYH